MPAVMKALTLISIVITVITAVLFICFDSDVFLTLAISFGTTAYHLGMRLLVGNVYNLIMKNKTDYTKKRYNIHKWERKLYKLLRVKSWKDKMPTYDTSAFSVEEHCWDEIAQAMCQSELIHETNAVLSFLPVIAAKRFGSFGIFLITSICGALFDLMFVIMQRYNRDRIVKMIGRKK